MQSIDMFFIALFAFVFVFHLFIMRRTHRRYSDYKAKTRGFFGDLLRTIEGTATDDENWSLDEYLRHVIDDVNSILKRDEADPIRSGFLQRYVKKREHRLTSNEFTKCERLTQRLVEVYPPLGILGTVSSLFMSSQFGGNGIDAIMQNFITAMWTTIAGLCLWIFFMLFYTMFEPEWERLPEAETKARNLVWDIDRAYQSRENL